jgi:hypothetical protein
MVNMDTSSGVPMRWPCGPLEIERGKRRESFTSQERDALERWSDPRALEPLARTPVSCLVLTWAAGSELDAEHQRHLAPLVTAARRAGFAVVGWVTGGDVKPAAGAAQSSGLDAIATLSGETAAGSSVLRFRERGDGDRSPAAFLGITGNLWPGFAESPNDEVDAWTGATGQPWLDSNAWYVRLARTLVAPKTLWLSFDPPETPTTPSATSYVQAIADTALYGARWVVSLDPGLRLGLAESRPTAMDTWTQIVRGLSFFQEHRSWGDYRPVGQLGVVSDYSGMDEFLSHEVLNLLARQGSLYRILEKKNALAEPFEELNAVLYVDESPPEADLLRKLYAFAEGGGTLITPPGWEERGSREDDPWFTRYRVSRYGKGRLAVAREELTDPHLLAEDAQLLMSHSHDRVRVFNPGLAQAHYSTTGDGRKGVLQVLRFMSRRIYAGRLTVWFRRPWASARTWQVGAAAAEPTERTPAPPGVEFRLPPVSVYCAVEVSA